MRKVINTLNVIVYLLLARYICADNYFVCSLISTLSKSKVVHKEL